MSNRVLRIVSAAAFGICSAMVTPPAYAAGCGKPANRTCPVDPSPVDPSLAAFPWADVLAADEIPADLLDLPLTLEPDASHLAKGLSAAPSLFPNATPASTGGAALWTKLEEERARDSARTVSAVGIKLQPAQSASLGMTVEGEKAATDATLSEQSRLAATFGLKASPLLSFEAKAAWGRLESGEIAGRVTQSYQNELSARLNGDWRVGAIKLSPSVTIAHAAEAASDAPRTPRGTVIVAPSISRPFALDNAQALEPFVTFKQAIDLGMPPAGTFTRNDGTRSAGGGIKLERGNSYSLSVSTEVENLEAERHALKSQLRLNLKLD